MTPETRCENCPEIFSAVGRLEAKVDTILELRQEAIRVTHDHETRISALERWRALLLGAWTVLATGMGILLGRS